MNHRKLGRTGLEVSEIGLGTEHLHGQPRQTVVSVIREAVSHGITYFDILFSFPDYLDNLGEGLRGLRDDLLITGHLGCAETDGQYRRSRDVQECQANFSDLLSRLRTDHLDVLMLQNVDEEDDYQSLIGPGGLLDLALRLKEEGKARFIGLSGHTVPVPLKAAQSGRFDVLMFPTNPMSDARPEDALPWDETPERPQHGTRRRFYELCATEGLGLVGMKPFAGGSFFQENPPPLTPVQALSYALSLPGVSTVVPGVKSPDELAAVLRYLSAGDDEKDFSAALARSAWSPKGSCVYCNHCLPCPSGIDIARTLRLADIAARGLSADLRADYRALPAVASDCTECGECVERCPFGVSVIEKMQRAARLFG